MKTTIKSLGAVILGGGLFISGCAKKQMTSFQSLKNPEVAAQLKSFVVEKEAQANAATNQMPSEFQAFFAAAEKGDWPAVSNTFEDFRKRSHDFDHPGPNDERLQGVQW
jgi:outer membrane murein-binding lipoprotein Lpp